jgi:Transposase zinc-binding domain
MGKACRFVEQEFRDFLQCGWLAGGFARFRCGDCGLDRLVPFSCKGRALYPSCGGRRMAERAAHLLDHVFPDVSVRQWVLSLPHRMRYRLAWNHVPRGRCRVRPSRAQVPARVRATASRTVVGARWP